MRCNLCLAFLMAAAFPATSHAAFLTSRLDLVDESLPTVLTDPFGATGPLTDVYHLVVCNPNPNPATSVELNLSGPFLNNFTFAQIDFQDSTDLPTPAGMPVAESFFVTPPGTVGIGRDDIDDENGILSAAYTIQGGATFIGPGTEAVLAVLSVPASAAIDQSTWTGFAAVNGVLETVFSLLPPHGCVPEPSSGALLLGLALAGLYGRR